MSEHMSPIPSRIYNAAVGGHVCGPEDVDFGQKVVHLIKYDRAGNEVSFESQVTQANKIYVIHDDFVLSSNVTIPANCVLEFDGGSISGQYTLTGNSTGIKACLVKIFNTDITFAGSWNIAEAYPEWFGAKGDGVNDDITSIQACLDASWVFKATTKLSSKDYLVSKPIVLWCSDAYLSVKTTALKGEGKGRTKIIKSGNATSGISYADVNSIILLLPYQYQDPEHTGALTDTCTSTYIEGMTLCSTSATSGGMSIESMAVQDFDYGIFAHSIYDCIFKDIVITNCKNGIYTDAYNYLNKYEWVDVKFASVAGFNIAGVWGGSAANTTLMFENCHTDGCWVSYILGCGAVLVNCAKDGGGSSFIKTTPERGVSRPRIVMLSCHCEPATMSEPIFDFESANVLIDGGVITTTDTLCFKASKGSKVVVKNATIVVRDGYTSPKLYECTLGSAVYFEQCNVNNTLYTTRQPLKNKEKTLFDAGVNEINSIIDTSSLATVTTSRDNINIKLSAANYSILIYLGEFTSDEYSFIRMYVDSHADDFYNLEMITSETVDSDGKPVNGTAANLARYNDYNEANINGVTVTKNTLMLADLPTDSSKKHVFINLYSGTNTSNIDLTIHKIYLG